ncbi:hypothetical protein [Sphingobium sp.]|uniref:hypothetical protein n=1 Tax=Sphingobium sp. TaxID=1912891 RepID=UPI003BB6F73C
MLDYAAIAMMRLTRMRALMHNPIPPAVPTPSARQAAASDDLTLSPRPSPHPSRSAVEAGRSAHQSDPGDECTCPVCTGDCADIDPCQRESEQ